MQYILCKYILCKQSVQYIYCASVICMAAQSGGGEAKCWNMCVGRVRGECPSKCPLPNMMMMISGYMAMLDCS